ncbi:uncharacterized protein [Setaria viridis]|uniref:uncharacterized protein n=1 Tax=Setaria viridis TaxID=4556 RepID=UPI0014936C49|nr:L10-interacting MYB domain-containing protein-like [Setaria viridis]
MDPPPAAGNLDPAVERGRSGGGLQDAPSGGANGAPYVSGGGAGGAPFVWLGGPPTGPLGALLAAAGVPPGMVAGAWPGGAATAAGQPPAQQPAIPAAAGLAAGAWPGIPGAWPGVPSAAMPASTSTPGGWPEWWAGAAAAALGPDWLRADPQLASQETASQEVGGNDERLPVRGSSTRRRGTRAPRPPPAARTATAPASVDVDLTDPSLADWCDENNRIVCEIFADEVLKGNRSSTHLSKTGYKNVIARFKERTGIEYTRKQFKNKWDKSKQDYGIWKQLKNKETGIGWDETGKNIVMSEAWWKKTAKDIKGSTRFKLKGLQNEEQLSIMFEDLRNTGDEHWSASSGIAPSSANLSRESSPIPIDDEDEADKVDSDSEPEEVTPRSVHGSKRGRGASNIKGKKPKTSTGHWFQEQMGKIVEMNERTTASCESIARREDTSGCSIQDVMALVKNCGALPSTNEHFVASLVFTKRAEREMFMTLDTPEERFDWLKRKYEWMTRNDVPK